MNTGCEFYEEALVELARGELEGERVRRVKDHLAGCPDCREALDVIRAVRAAPAPAPDGLEARIQAAVRRQVPVEDAVPPGRREAPSTLRLEPRRWAGRRVWALPVAAAAAVALWLGANELITPDATPGEEVVAEYEPYGTWPATDGVVAGDLVLSELSVEELEALLEEMER